MGEQLGQAVVVENRAGGDGLLGIRAVKDAPADGYTLLASAGTIAIQPAVKKEPGYDLAQDFTGIGPMIRFPLLMVVGSKQPDKTLEEFIARAKANPRDMSYASAGVGTTTHVGAAMFLQRTGLSLLHVPYKGNGAAMTDVMAGRVSMVFEAYGSSASKVKDGTLRALGVTSTARLPSLPDVPTIAEQGIPDFSYYLYLGLLSPAGTPKEVVQRLSNALQSALSSTELKERFRNEGSEAMIMSSGEFDEFLKQDVARMSKLAAELGLPKE
jgi:tripartite-type tricarboxylate transporter receptor subunit TctC